MLSFVLGQGLGICTVPADSTSLPAALGSRGGRASSPLPRMAPEEEGVLQWGGGMGGRGRKEVLLLL